MSEQGGSSYPIYIRGCGTPNNNVQGGSAIPVHIVGSDVEVADGEYETLYIGDGTNGIRITIGGELTLEGTATRWLDERGVLTGARVESPASKVQVDNAEGGSESSSL